MYDLITIIFMFFSEPLSPPVVLDVESEEPLPALLTKWLPAVAEALSASLWMKPKKRKAKLLKEEKRTRGQTKRRFWDYEAQAQILERIAEAISNGLSKTEAWEKVHAECGIPAGNFSRWCKMQDHIWSMAAKMRASRLLGPMARKVWRGRSTRRKPAKSGQFEAFEKKLLEEKCFQHSAFKLFLIKFVISRLGQMIVEQFFEIAC